MRGLALARRHGRGLPIGALDREQSAQLELPYAGVHGWAVAEPGLDRVEVSLGGRAPVRARLFAEPRPDIAARSAEPSAAICGWEAPLDLSELEVGDNVTIAATAHAGGRAVELGSVEMQVHAGRSTGAIDADWLRTLRARAVAATPDVPRTREGLRVAIFTHQLDIGGAQLYLQELIRRLLEHEAVVCAVYSQTDGALRAELESWGVQVHITGQEPRLGSIYEARMAELAPFVAAFRPNVALINTSVAFWGVDVAELLGIPSVWTIHESVPVAHYPHIGWPPLDEHVASRFTWALQRADRVVFEAVATRDLYRPWVDDARATQIDYGIDIAQISADRSRLDRERLRRRLALEPDQPVILCMGTIEPRKAQASLALAFARLAAEFPRAVLVLVGDRDLPYSRALRVAVGRLGLAPDRIRIEPISTRTSEWYELADAFALPSDLESLPRSILEAMAFDLPVLAADAFGVTEVVADGVNGFVCEPRSLDSLTAALRRLLAASPTERRALGEAGGAAIRATRDSSGYGREFVELMRTLTHENPVAGRQPASV